MFGMRYFFPAILVLMLSVSVAVAQKDVAPDAIRTTILDAQGLKDLVRDSDKPLLINFWATWCGPCRAEFPDLVKIDLEYREKGLNFVVVSLDNVALADTAVSDFLKSYDAEMPSYLLDAEERREITRAIRGIAPRFTGGFPATMLFNRSGRLIYLKGGVINDRLLRNQIDKALKK